MVTSTGRQATEFGERALSELEAVGEIEAGWRVAYETAEDCGGAKAYRLWFEKYDHSDSFSIRLEVSVKADAEETDEATVEEIKRLVRAHRL